MTSIIYLMEKYMLIKSEYIACNTEKNNMIDIW